MHGCIRVFALVLLFPWISSASLLVDSLKQKGFSCTSRREGDICAISKLANAQLSYSQPVAILVPLGVERPERLLLHLHGYKGVCEAANAGPVAMSDEFDFLGQMKDAGATNAVMIYPMSTGNDTTYINELVPRLGRLLTWAEGLTQAQGKRWILSGHSGAGFVISAALEQAPSLVQKLDSILLLDATYGIAARVGEWTEIANAIVQRKSATVVYSAYIPGTSTEAGSDQLEQLLKKKKVRTSFSKAVASHHCAVPSEDYARFLRERPHFDWGF